MKIDKSIKKQMKQSVEIMMKDENIVNKWIEWKGTKNGLKSFVSNCADEYFLGEFNPYYDKGYLDVSYTIVEDKMINLDDFYYLIIDNMNDDIMSEQEENYED